MPGYHKKPKKYVSDAQRKAVHASKKDGGKGNPNKPKMIKKKTTPPPTPGGHKTRRIKKEQAKRRVLAKDGRNYITLSPGGKSGAVTLIGDAGKGPIGKPLPTKPPTSGKVINKPKAKFPDLSGDGKITKKDILMGRGVIDKPKMLRKKRKNYA